MLRVAKRGLVEKGLVKVLNHGGGQAAALVKIGYTSLSRRAQAIFDRTENLMGIRFLMISLKTTGSLF
jgi:hypothetical protein